MIHSRISSKAQTTIPRAVREALGVSAGDEIAYEIAGDEVIVRRRARISDDPFMANLSTFTEWESDADCRAFADL